MTRTFDYVAYDEKRTEKQNKFKAKFVELEAMADELVEGRAKSLFLTNLEEAYMWTGKAIRDEQIKELDSPDSPSRTNI